MPYRVIKGEYVLAYTDAGGRIRGGEPDGDSVWFRPARGARSFAGLPGPDGRPRDVDLNKAGCAQLRFEGIDALELHYPGRHHQKSPECVTARDHLLDAIGFGPRQFATPTAGTIAVRVAAAAAPHPVPGYVLCRVVDRYQRPVSFAFAGTTTQRDGSDVHMNAADFGRSINAVAAREGNAYPAFYETLPWDIRNSIAQAAAAARAVPKGIWSVDTSATGTDVGSLAKLERAAIWPKLYRRLASYYDAGATGLGGFLAWLRDPQHRSRNDRLSVLSIGALDMHLDDVIEIQGQLVRM